MTLIKRNLAPGFPLFDDILTKDLFNWGFNNNSSTNTTLPSVNIVESRDAFSVEMAAPGMEKSDFNVVLDNEVLTIQCERKDAQEQDEKSFVRREFWYQSFQRTFHLPKSVVDGSKIKATYENGILSIMIPKKEEAKTLPMREIKVS